MGYAELPRPTMPTCSICEQPCQRIEPVHVPARSREYGPSDAWRPFDDWGEQMVGECCADFVNAMFHGAGEGWKTLIAFDGGG